MQSHTQTRVYLTLVDTCPPMRCAVVFISLGNPVCELCLKMTLQCFPAVQSEQSREGPAVAYHLLFSIEVQSSCSLIQLQSKTQTWLTNAVVCACVRALDAGDSVCVCFWLAVWFSLRLCCFKTFDSHLCVQCVGVPRCPECGRETCTLHTATLCWLWTSVIYSRLRGSVHFHSVILRWNDLTVLTSYSKFRPMERNLAYWCITHKILNVIRKEVESINTGGSLECQQFTNSRLKK